MKNEQHNTPTLAPLHPESADNAPALSPSAVMYWDGGERAITAREKALIEEHRSSCFSIPLIAVPAGWALVPERMMLDPSAMDYLATQLGGPEPDSRDLDERWCAGLLWVGETQDDDGKKYYGLNVANTECPEEGSIPVVEFPATASPATFQLAGPEPLWCLHVLGMDDVHPAPSKAHAQKAAAWHNDQFKEQAARLGINIEAVVVPWPHCAESHAAGVADFIPEWLIPQWQLDALQSKDAAPSPGIDLAQLERIRNELHAMSGQVPDEWVDPLVELQQDVQKLIDGQRNAAPVVSP